MCCSVAEWLVFSDVWNAIVDELRTVDLISDGEQRNLSFVHLPFDDSIEVLYFNTDTRHASCQGCEASHLCVPAEGERGGHTVSETRRPAPLCSALLCCIATWGMQGPCHMQSIFALVDDVCSVSPGVRLPQA
jgi:hypothetical protein